MVTGKQILCFWKKTVFLCFSDWESLQIKMPSKILLAAISLTAIAVYLLLSSYLTPDYLIKGRRNRGEGVKLWY